ncbi:hypothetical protein [Metabacillus bambusae]|uniref:Uncharacterized protein n=1 Tax=Metabacillus bambusae TaxID=2795218 RepID=A0ABS3MZR8_9BACI|nr:hypothetical protein [Metabacillus bambusae]MBO1511331.1 hypothetical protein [Metabacillus bambusae]
MPTLRSLVLLGFRRFFITSTHNKKNYPNYLDLSLRLANLSVLIVVDNVLQGGRVYDSFHVEESSHSLHFAP